LAQAPGTALAVRDEWDGNVAIVTVQGEIDTTTVGVLSECLGHVVQKNPERMVIDLAAVGFLDSSAMHAIVRARHALPRECPLVLRSAQRQARRVFELTGLDSVCVLE
jgi:stage II sporulation protein AA (anti-sigma F factor antagonist)